MKFLTKEEFAKLSKTDQDTYVKNAEALIAGAKAAGDSKLKQLTMPEFEAKIKGVIEKLIKPMTAVDRKNFMFPGVGNMGVLAGDKSGEAKFVKTIKFLKAIASGEVQTLKAMSDEVKTKANLNEATGAQGAFLVPEEFAAEILRLAPIYGVARRECRIIPMRYDVINFPGAGSTNITAHFTNEAAQIYTTNPNFRQVSLVINKLASIPKVTSELLSDANVNVVEYLAMIIAEQFAKREDEECFIGTGSPFVGAINATGVPTYPHMGGTGFETLSYQDVARIPGFTYSAQLPNAKFFFHRTMISHIQSRITTAGAPIFPGVVNQVLGYPLVPVEVLPGIGHTAYQTTATTYAVFGDFKRGMLMGERGTIEMKIATEGTVLGDNLFEKDMSALRMIERICFGCALPSAFVVIETA